MPLWRLSGMIMALGSACPGKGLPVLLAPSPAGSPDHAPTRARSFRISSSADLHASSASRHSFKSSLEARLCDVSASHRLVQPSRQRKAASSK